MAKLNYEEGLRLHDVMLAYLRNQWSPSELRTLHQRLLLCWSERCALPHAYAWRNYSWHCLQAGEPEKLASALFDLQWLTARLIHPDFPSLLTDCLRIQEAIPSQKEKFTALCQVLELSTPVLLKEPQQLAGQIYGRLRRGQSVELDALIDQTDSILSTQELRPVTQNLLPAGSSLKRTLGGYDIWVIGALVLPDGRLLSWSADDTLRLWSNSGKPIAMLYFDAIITTIVGLPAILRLFVGDGLGGVHWVDIT